MQAGTRGTLVPRDCQPARLTERWRWQRCLPLCAHRLLLQVGLGCLLSRQFSGTGPQLLRRGLRLARSQLLLVSGGCLILRLAGHQLLLVGGGGGQAALTGCQAGRQLRRSGVECLQLLLEGRARHLCVAAAEGEGWPCGSKQSGSRRGTCEQAAPRLC